MPLTATGTADQVVSPVPSAPRWLLPQHHAAPSVARAHVWSPPEAIAWNASPPDTGAGAVPAPPPTRPRPSPPHWFTPQHSAVPEVVSAHEILLPAEMATY